MTATPVQPQRVEFVRAISRLDATALVVGSMIGSGIFIVSADILRQVHSPGLLLTVWLLSGVVTLLGALSYGGRAVRLSPRGDLTAVRLPLRLDPVRRDSDRDDRGGRRRVRALHLGARSWAHARCLPGHHTASPPTDRRHRRRLIRATNLCDTIHRDPYLDQRARRANGRVHPDHIDRAQDRRAGWPDVV